MRFPLAMAIPLALALACPALAAPATTNDAPLTVERLFEEPSLEGDLPVFMGWLPDGQRFGLLERTGEGKAATVRLSIVDAASGAAKPLVEAAALPAFGAGDAAVQPMLWGGRWSPKADALLLEGGGDLFLYDVKTGGTRRLTATPSREEGAQFSPDGRFVAYVRDNDLHALELASGRELRLTSDGGPNRVNGAYDWLYEEELAGRGSLPFAWSPDSRAIALLTLDETNVPRMPLTDLLPARPATREQIYPKAGAPNPVPGLRVVPVVQGDGAPAARELRWNDDRVYLVRLGWMPGGGAVWYQLLDRAQTRLELNRLDLSTGLSTTLHVETDAAWINLHDDLHFLKDGRFLWSTERDGFRHLWLHAADGRPLRALTQGAWDVGAVELVDEAAGAAWFTSNQSSPLETQLWRVDLAGGAPRRVTVEPGTHQVRLAPGGRFALDTWSRADRPRALFVLDGAGKRLRALAANENPPLAAFPRGAVELHTIERAGKAPLYASLVKPPGFDPAKRYPVVVYLYGGPHAQVVRDAWGGRYALFHQFLASKGFLVFSVDNRGSAGRGRTWERALLKRLGQAELEDQLEGLAWLKAQPFVDGSRVGIWGWSYGGYMTLYAMTHSDAFKAGVAVAPVTDWHYYDSAYTERYLKLPADNPDGYRDSSPVHDAAKLQGTLLLVHGTGDDNVHWQNTLAFVDALYRAGKPYDLQLYPNKNHGMAPGRESHKHLHARIAEHFVRALAP